MFLQVAKRNTAVAYSVSNCSNSGAVSCTSTASFTTQLYVGGIAGTAESSNSDGRFECAFYKCSNSGKITLNGIKGGSVGGIVGKYGETSYCYNTGAITGSATNGTVLAGGILGYGSSNITRCYNKGTVSGDYAGGITGIMDAATVEAVKAYQAAHGLDPDGEVGGATWAALLQRG